MCVPESSPSRVNRWLIVFAVLGVAAALWLGRPWLATVTAGVSLASLLLCLLPCLIPLAFLRRSSGRSASGARSADAA